MLLSKTIEITINPRDINKFKEFNIKCGDKLIINVDDLSKNSNRRILVKCDICGKEKEISYMKYLKNIEKHNIYSCSSKCSISKREKTNIIKFGCSYYSKTNEYKERNRETCLEKYGVENVFQNDDIKQKIKETCLEKYDTEHHLQNKVIMNKQKKTNLEKYGVDNVSKSEEIKNKIKNTCLEKYGVEYSYQSDFVKNKIKETCLEKYGVEHSSQIIESRLKYKDTCLEKYGVDNVSKSEEIKKIKEETTQRRYGVKHVSQVPDFFEKQQKSGYRLHLHENTNLNYRGTYEKDFLDFCFNNKILIEKGKRIKYLYNDKEHYYFSDFYIESFNLIIEIKSYWTFNKYFDKNIIKKKFTIDSGFNYIFIIDKNYEDFKKFINIL